MAVQKKTWRKVRRGLAKVGRRVKSRYYGKRKGLKLTTLAGDVWKIKQMLNTEHKHIDFKFGSGQIVPLQLPSNNTPIILEIPTPVRGTSYNNRVGNQIKIVNITAKWKFQFTNQNNYRQRITATGQIIFAKSADDIPTIMKLYDPDADGHYTPNSFVNTQEYKKYVWMKSLTGKASHLETTVAQTGVADVQTATYYSNRQASRLNLRVMFQNNSENVEQMKPYILLRSDVVNTPFVDPDAVLISGNIRMTYVDN